LAYVSVSEVKSSAWSGAAAAAYDMGFARLCQGAVGEVLDRVERLSGVGSLLDLGAGTGRLSTEGIEGRSHRSQDEMPLISG